MDKIAQIESVIKLLITIQPHVSSPEPNKGIETVEDQFKESFEHGQNLIRSDPQYFWIKDYPEIDSNIEGDYYWEYVKFGLKILKCLNDHLSAESSPSSSSGSGGRNAGLLNVKQQNSVQKTCEFIVILGVGRNIMPGLGVPWEKRSKYATSIPKNDDYSLFQKQQQLYATLKALMEISQYHIIGNVLFSKCLPDLLAGLCQLTYWPIKKDYSRENVQIINQIRDFSRQLLHTLIERSYQPKVIRELLFLNGFPTGKDCSTDQQPPQFIRKNVSKMLEERLLKKYGLKSFALAILESGKNEEKLEQRDCMKCDVIVRVISSLAANKNHFAVLCPQILTLLDDDSDDLNQRNLLIRIAKMITINFVSINQELVEDLIFYQQFKPLMVCTVKICKSTTEKEIELRLPTEKEIELCITSLHKLYTSDDGPSQTISKFLSPIVGVLFHMYSFLIPGISHLKTLTEQLLGSYFKNIDKNDIVNVSRKLLFKCEDENDLLWNTNLKINVGPESGILITKRMEPLTDLDWLDLGDKKTSAFSNLLLSLNGDDKLLTLFLSLLEELSSGFDDESVDVSTIKEAAKLINIEKNQRRKELNLRKFVILSALSQNDSLQESMMKNKAATIIFLKRVFERGAKLCQISDAELMKVETLQMAMSLLTLVANEQEFSKVKNDLRSIVSSLQIIASKHTDESICTAAEELYKYIATMGAIPLTSLISKTSAESKPNSTSKTKSHSDGSPTSLCKQLYEELQDSDIPTKGHALISCTKLIQSKNKEVTENKECVLEILLNNLEHEDSYVYLLATQAIAALAAECPSFTLPTLLEKYSDQSNPILQMKVGEVILKLVVQLNDYVVVYRDRLISSFLNSTKNDDPIIRASSLSNLGELCKGLKFSLGNNINELFLHLSIFAKCDSSPLVRCAAIQVITLLLRGLGKDALKVLEDILKDIYRLLKYIATVEKEENVQLHVQLAMEELNIICKDFFFPPQLLEKKIRVLERF